MKFALLTLLALASTPELRVLPAAPGEVPSAAERRVKLGTKVTLHLALREGARVTAEPKRVDFPGLGPRDAARPPPATIRWYRVEPSARSLSNTDPSFHWEPIPYTDVELEACRDRWSCEAVVTSTSLGDRGGLGTMTFRATLERGGVQLRSPGSEERYRGGLTEKVARVTVRRDDSYLGHLTELFLTPYIWGSEGIPATTHQAERRIGSDCADFVTYGARRLGHDVPYTSTWSLADHAREVSRAAAPGADGVWRDGKGEALRVGPGAIQPGDLLLFPRHVGALVRDEPPLGVLSGSDVMIHTCWAEPTEQSIAEAGWGNREVRVLRFSALEGRRPK